jgi:nucleoid-associated protein YgaU
LSGWLCWSGSKQLLHFFTRRKLIFPAAALVPLFVLCVQSVFGQDLGEIARRERAKNKQAPATHVYTNDDLKRSEILLPEDRARIEADRKTPNLNAPESAAAPFPQLQNAKPAEIPLGDVARYYREIYRLQGEQWKARRNILPGAPALAMPKLSTPDMILSPRRERGLRDPFSRARRESPATPRSVLPRHAPVARETPRAAESIQVRRGDSLWKLAARYLGDGAKWHAILAVNPQLSDPNRIRIGERLALPQEVQTPTQSASTLRVVRGDSMWKLAQNHLGSGLAWSCIALANPQIEDADRIYPGQTLTMPASCGPVAPDATLQSARASH